jgi:site-specific recombinase
MAEAKLEIKVGTVAFTGEGAENWLAEQLDKLLLKLPELLQAHCHDEDKVSHEKKETAKSDVAHHSPKKGITLAVFLKEKKATSNQARKFLATALWLHDERAMNKDLK